jgi:hypothetical protein
VAGGGGGPVVPAPSTSRCVVGADVNDLASFSHGLAGTLDLSNRSNSKQTTGDHSSTPLVKEWVMAMSASFGTSFYVPASHAYDGKTMNFEGGELTYASAYKRLVTLHEAAYLFKPGTKNNGKIRDRADHQHNCLKGVWKRVVKPTKPMDKALKEVNNQSRKITRQKDRSDEADARGRARVKVEKANKKANLDAAAFGACLQLEVTSDQLAPAFDDVLRARQTKIEENARRRSETIEDVEVRLAKAVELGLIEQTVAFDEGGLNREISRILHMKIKIGNEEKTLHELFEEYAVYFGFTSLSGAQQTFEQSAFLSLTPSELLRFDTQMVTVSQNPISGRSLSLKCCFSLMCVPIFGSPYPMERRSSRVQKLVFVMVGIFMQPYMHIEGNGETAYARCCSSNVAPGMRKLLHEGSDKEERARCRTDHRNSGCTGI